MGDSVLERNLCFVDTPGYGNKTSVSTVCDMELLANFSSVWNVSRQLWTMWNRISKRPLLWIMLASQK